MDKLILGLLFVFLIILPSYALADPSTYLNIPPTNAFDKIRTDSGSVSAVNFSMPLKITGGTGVSVSANNATHTVTITNTQSTNTHTGSYNQTLANNVVKNSGGQGLNFINGTNNPIVITNDPTRNQVNITISSTGSGGGGVTSLNALSGALNIVGVAGNTTVTTSGGNTITINTAFNIVTTGGSTQNITKNLIINKLLDSSNIVGASDQTKKLNISLGGMTTGKILTLSPSQTTTQTLNIPNISGSDTLATLGLSQTFSGNNIWTNNANNFTDRIKVYHSEWSGDQGGAIELGGLNTKANPITNGVPYIDWHFGNGKAQDYNIRIMNNANNTLFIQNPTSGTIIQFGDNITSYVSNLLQKKITQYNSINTAGWGVPAIYASVNQLSVSGSGTILSYTPPATSGIYKVHIAMDIHQPSSSPVTVGWNMTDQNPYGIHFTDIAQPEFCTSSLSGSTAYSFSVASSNMYCSGETNINIDNTATAIVVKFKVYSGTLGSAIVSSWIERVG